MKTNKRQRKSSRSLKTGKKLMAITAINLLAGFIISALLIRLLGVDSFGSYSFYIALASIVAMPVQFGLPGLATREVAKLRGKQQYDQLSGIIRWTAHMTLILIALASFIVFLIFTIKSNQNSIAEYASIHTGIIALIVSMGIISVCAGILQGFERQVLARLADALIRPFILIVALLMCFAFNYSNWQTTFLLNAFSCVIASVVALVILVKFLKKQADINWTDRQYHHRQWITATASLALLSGVAVISRRMDILLLGNLSTAKQVAYYALAIQLSSIMLVGQTIVNSIVAPKISKHYAAGDISQVQRLSLTATKLSLSFTIAALVAIVTAGGPFISLMFGEEMLPVLTLLMILSFGTILSACCGPTGTILRMTGNERTSIKLILSVILIKVVLAIILVPIYGATGAATLTATCLVLLQLAMAYYANNLTGVDGGIWRLFSREH